MPKNKQIIQKNKRQESPQSTILILVSICICLFLMQNVSAIWTNNLNDGIVSYWNFDIGGTDNARGINNCNGNATHLSSGGILSGFYNFTGGDILDCGNDASLKLRQNITVSFWIKQTLASITNNAQLIIMPKQVGGTGRVWMVVADTKIHAYIDTDIAQVSTGLGTNGVASSWQLYTLTYNGTYMSWYINGTFLQGAEQTGFINTEYIGSPNSSLFFNGAVIVPSSLYQGGIDEVGIWNRALNSSEVSSLYNGGTPPTYVPETSSNISVTLNTPLNNSYNSSSPMLFNVSYVPLVLNKTNATYYIYNPNGSIFNKTVVTLNNLSNSSVLSVPGFIIGNYKWNVYACGVNGTGTVCSWSSDGNHSFSWRPFEINSQIYNSPVSERTPQTFSINISYNSSDIVNIQGILVYNGSEYSGTKYGTGDNIIFNRTITVPAVSTSTNFTFYWKIVVTGGEVNSNSTVQLVVPISMGSCSTNAYGLFNFTIYDEISKNWINNTLKNTIGKINLELYTSDRSSLITSYSQNFTKINPFNVCINSTLTSGEKYSLDLQLSYEADDYVKEFYHIQDYTVQDGTLNQNVSLYDLDNASSTTFKITYKDENFLPVENALIQIQRKYVDEGIFRTVEIPRTDSNGETLAHLEETNVIYTFIVVKNGVILATFDNFLVKCEDPVLGKCNINLNSFKGFLQPSDFINLNDFSFTMSYNRTTRTVQSIFSVPSGSTANVFLNVTKYDAFRNETLCSDSLTSASGTLSCVIPSTYGNATIVTEIYKDGKIVGRRVFGLDQNPVGLYGGNIAFLGFIMVIMLLGVSLGGNPVISGIFLIIGGIALIAFNIFTNSGFIGYGATILWLIIAVVVMIIKAARRE